MVAPEEEIGDWNQGAARIQVSVELEFHGRSFFRDGCRYLFKVGVGVLLMALGSPNFVWGLMIKLVFWGGDGFYSPEI